MGKYKILPSEHDKIIQQYLSGSTTIELGEQYGVNSQAIVQILHKHNVPIHYKRKYTLNENYFDIIDTPNKAYILGFLYADGYNSLRNHSIALALQEEDKYILDAINNEIGSNRPLEFNERSKKNPNLKNIYRLIISSKHISNVLNDIGMLQKKSLILTFPTCLDEDLYSHFIRGYFDGDGWICKRKYGEKISIVSTKEFCETIADIFYKYTGVKSHFKVRHKDRDSNTVSLEVYGRKQSLKVLDYIYQDCTMYLTRKYDIYQTIYKQNNINDNSLKVAI